MRYLLGMRNDALVGGAVDSSGLRTTPAAIKAYLDGGMNLLDVDGSGGPLDALTDGLLIMRYLFGFRGDALINGAVSASATRKSASTIGDYIDSLMSIKVSLP
ncbi:MAG: hypothetical protein HQL93_08220 [Magnetococcales bacterium]|nr:hypothetical protein [Magnetococcales bacterium]